MMVRNFSDFVAALLQAGFSMGGGNSEGVFAVIPWSWYELPPYPTPVCWHTGDPETDPWEWRLRVLEERDDIAYAKLFFGKSGYITREWYPYFLAVRRGGRSLSEEYYEGNVSRYAKRIYDVIAAHEALPVHEIKRAAGFTREDGSAFDRGLIELQRKMYVTMCGSQRKLSKTGEEYGWPSTAFCTVEKFFGKEIMEEAGEIDAREAVDVITRQVYRLNPSANPRKVQRFIRG